MDRTQVLGLVGDWLVVRIRTEGTQELGLVGDWLVVRFTVGHIELKYWG